MRGRIGGGGFHAAGTLNLSSSASLEIGVIEATDRQMGGDSFENTNVNAKGVRAVLSFNSGELSGRVGFESGKVGAGLDRAGLDRAVLDNVQGFGGTISYDTGSLKITGNYASGKVENARNLKASAYALSIAIGGFGAGYVAASVENSIANVTHTDKVDTVYASYSIPLFGVKGAAITPAISSSTAKLEGFDSQSRNDIRVRIHYDF